MKTIKLKSIGERSDYTCTSHLFPILNTALHSLTDTFSIVNTVSFMNWVVIENTFVIVAASIPLLRPLFNIAKQNARTAYGHGTSYEMNSRSQGTKGFSTNKSQNHTKSIQLQSSSEENILPVQGGFRNLTSVAAHNNREVGDQEKGIKKETTVHVSYEEDDGNTPPESKWHLGK